VDRVSEKFLAAKTLKELWNCSQLVTDTPIRTKKLDSCKRIPVNPAKCHVINKFLGFKRFCPLATRVPIIVPQRAEEPFPAVRESIVSVFCLCAQARILLFYVSSLGQRN
jgi:hypothetical protein